MVDRGFKFAEAHNRSPGCQRQPNLLETMSLHDPRHYVRRVVLPSGKTIEVVYFEDQQAAGAAPVPRPPPAKSHDEAVDDLHVCGSCASTLVYPTEWEEAGATHWEVTLRCPNCEWAGTGIFEQDARRALRRGARPRHRGARPRPQAPRARQHGGRDRALHHGAHRGSHRPRGLLDRRALPSRSAVTQTAGRLGCRPVCDLNASGVALDDAVGDQRRARCAARLGRPSGQRGLRRRDDRSSALARAPRPARRSPRCGRRRPRPAAGVVDRPRGRARASSGSRSRARISGSVTVPSSRSVPRCLPVRSAGPETSSTSSRIWKARPMRRAERARARRRAASARRPRSAPRRQAASNSARGLQLAAPQVALDGDVGARRRRAAAARPRRAPSSRPRARARCVAVAVARPARRRRARRAGRRSRSRRRGPRRRRPSGARGAAARGRARRRGRASPCARSSTATAARTSAARRRRGSAAPQRGTRAAGAAACRPRRSSRRRARRAPRRGRPATSRSSSSTRPAARRHVRRRGARSPRRPSTRRRRRVMARARAVHDVPIGSDGLAPTWIAMIPPAVSTQRISRQAGALAAPPPARAGAGKRLTEFGR